MAVPTGAKGRVIVFILDPREWRCEVKRGARRVSARGVGNRRTCGVLAADGDVREIRL